jgi:hypothetical protein
MTNKKDNIIIWQKWVDPFGEDEFPEDVSSLDDAEPEFYDDEANHTDSLDNNFKNKEPSMHTLKRNIKVIATPMGIIPVTDNTASGKIFNFWLGHSNFNITTKIASIIEETDGVETLDIFTRYRFRISVGKAFNDSDVMRHINENVYGCLE